ncbi:hypothetical protein Droror1_Dr00000235, partial [Drosera rotundifolia]
EHDFYHEVDHLTRLHLIFAPIRKCDAEFVLLIEFLVPYSGKYVLIRNRNEFLHLWFKEHCNPYEDEVLPDAPEELVSELAWRSPVFFSKHKGAYPQEDILQCFVSSIIFEMMSSIISIRFFELAS